MALDGEADQAAKSAPPPTARAWRVALEHIESRLLSGELRPGDHLPPERQLAADLGVARSSVREAIRVLEVLGLVRTATGSGPNAGAIIVAHPQGDVPRAHALLARERRRAQQWARTPVDMRLRDPASR